MNTFTWPQKLLLMLLVKYLWVMQSKSLVGMQIQLHKKQLILTHGSVCLLLSQGYSSSRPRWLKRECTSLFRNTLWMTIWVFFGLLIVYKRTEEYYWIDRYCCALAGGAENSKQILKLLNLSKDDALNKEGKNSRTTAPRIRIVLFHVSFNTIIDSLLCRNKTLR